MTTPVQQSSTSIAQSSSTHESSPRNEVKPPIHDANIASRPNPGLLPPIQTQALGFMTANSSTTAVNPDQTPQTQPQPIQIQPQPHPKPAQSVYESWNPADCSTKSGRPAWWNRYFCCGYGVGCVLCLCGSVTCWQERQRQETGPTGEKGSGDEAKRA